MATKKKAPAKKKAVKAPAIPKVKSTDFLGRWETFKSTFLGESVNQLWPSSWTILPGYVYKDYSGSYKCKVSENIIHIPTNSSVWVGQMQPDGTMQIYTFNGMGCFYCKKNTEAKSVKKVA